MIDVSLFYFEDYIDLKELIKINRLKKIYISDIVDKFINEDEDLTRTIIVYKKFNVVSLSNLYENELTNKFKRINLLDIELFKKIFEKNFSNNLCSIGLIFDDNEDCIEYIGNRLTELEFLSEYDFYSEFTTIKLKYYSIQPNGYRYLIKISEFNKIQFNKKYKESDIETIIMKLIEFVIVKE